MNTDMKPAVSIVIPTYEMGGHGVSMLEELMLSVLEQSFRDWEIVISDTCFTERKPHPKRSNVFYVQGKAGAAANLNAAIDAARGDIIKPMFQDDQFMEPESLQKIVDAFSDDTVQWIACISQNIGLDNYIHVPYRPSSIEALRLGENTYGCPSVMAWRANHLRMDENLKFLFDCEFYARMQERYGFPAYVQTPIYVRAWEGQATRTVCDGATRITDRNEVIEKYRDRGGVARV